MLTVLFTVSYQSIHAFSHPQNLVQEYCKKNCNSEIKKHNKSFTEKEDCTICDFKFVAFVATDLIQFTFFPPFYAIPYQLNSNETCVTFNGNSFYLRGPPTLV